jgi:hypothetical protein
VTAPPKGGSDPVWAAFLCFIGVAIAVIAGRLITPSTIPLAVSSGSPPVVAQQKVKPSAIPSTWQGKPISAWRRAYILKHGHQPPARKE